MASEMENSLGDVTWRVKMTTWKISELKLRSIIIIQCNENKDILKISKASGNCGIILNNLIYINAFGIPATKERENRPGKKCWKK